MFFSASKFFLFLNGAYQEICYPCFCRSGPCEPNWSTGQTIFEFGFKFAKYHRCKKVRVRIRGGQNTARWAGHRKVNSCTPRSQRRNSLHASDCYESVKSLRGWTYLYLGSRVFCLHGIRNYFLTHFFRPQNGQIGFDLVKGNAFFFLSF